MPLLKKKAFEKITPSDYLRDNEEVFYCDVTNEIFRDYEEFAERMLLCNSMVWTCSFTGKSNLTYQEALESEENAKKSIKEFPLELRVPILYIATKTSRTSFGEMAEDVFIYAKDRYFIGENIEASFTGNKWIESHVLQVISPSPEEIKKHSSPKNGNASKHLNPFPHLYKYEIEHLDADDADISEMMIVDNNQIKRRKVFFSREKCKLFLKQYVEQDSRNVFVIKESARKEFNLDSMKFDKIFNGPEPHFESSKKLDKIKEKESDGGKKKKQMTLGDYLKSNGEVKINGQGSKSNNAKEKKSNLLDQMEKRREEFDRLKKVHKDEILAKKQQEKEMMAIQKKLLREWSKPKEDLELEDQQVLPDFPCVISKIPEKYLGDIFMMMEFVDLFAKDLSLKQYFPVWDFKVIENTMLDTDIAGQFYSLIEMLLIGVFIRQDTEFNDFKISFDKPLAPKPPANNTLLANSHLATWAATWSKRQHGMRLSELPISTLSITEILRMHLLASGAQTNDNGEKARFSNRGLYVNTDDPGLYLRVHKPYIIKFLNNKHISQMKLRDRIDVVSCLIDQLLTHNDFRSKIEDRLQKSRDARFELRSIQAAEKKREIETSSKREKIMKLKLNQRTEKLEEFEDCDAKAKEKYNKEMQKLQRDADENLLGMDRAYRKFWKLDSLPGILINCEEENVGVCLDEAVVQKPELIGAKDVTILKHIQDSLENSNGSNKENDLSKISLNNISYNAESNDILLMCSSDKLNCKVHGNRHSDSKWRFISNEDQLEQLLAKLNPRGIRESELQQNMLNEKTKLVKYLGVMPIDHLNKEEAARLNYITENTPSDAPTITRSKKSINPNLGFPLGTTADDILMCSLTTDLLEMEERIFSGSLGQLLVPSRAKWRKCLENKQFNTFDKTISRRADIEQEDEEDDEVLIETRYRKYVDPGEFLSIPEDYQSDSDDDEGVEVKSEQSIENQVAVECLAIALAQIAQAIEQRYLKKPLGNAKLRNKSYTLSKIRNRLPCWEQSLLSSKSFSQIYLHYYSLDSCIFWHRSTFNAYCRICRRKHDSENMLLCDSCNRGHHLYCLTPKLTKIPKGDWFCELCTEEKNSSKTYKGDEVMPQKKKRIFKKELEDEEEAKVDNIEKVQDSDDEDDENNEDNESKETSSDSDDSQENLLDVCDLCKSGGDLISCNKCETPFHRECVGLIANTRNKKWLCTKCNKMKYSGDDEDERGLRRSKREKTSFTNGDDYDYDTEEETLSKKRRSYRAESGRNDLPLHNAILQDLLTQVMKHEAAWPFLRPVLQKEVPDYYEVISNPMDFGTIKYKLNMGKYSEDAQLMDDVALIFENCGTYNDSSSEIYSCAVRLYEFFIDQCDELRLKPRNSESFSKLDFEVPKKKRRK